MPSPASQPQGPGVAGSAAISYQYGKDQTVSAGTTTTIVNNSGTIIGKTGNAIRFSGGNSGSNRMIVTPGAVFGNGSVGGVGKVLFPSGGSNVLELAGTAGSTLYISLWM